MHKSLGFGGEKAAKKLSRWGKSDENPLLAPLTAAGFVPGLKGRGLEGSAVLGSVTKNFSVLAKTVAAVKDAFSFALMTDGEAAMVLAKQSGNAK